MMFPYPAPLAQAFKHEITKLRGHLSKAVLTSFSNVVQGSVRRRPYFNGSDVELGPQVHWSTSALVRYNFHFKKQPRPSLVTLLRIIEDAPNWKSINPPRISLTLDLQCLAMALTSISDCFFLVKPGDPCFVVSRHRRTVCKAVEIRNLPQRP